MSAVIIRKVANGLIAYPMPESGAAGFPDPESISVFKDGDSIFISDYLTKAFAQPPVNVAAELKAVQGELDAGSVGP